MPPESLEFPQSTNFVQVQGLERLAACQGDINMRHGEFLALAAIGGRLGSLLEAVNEESAG